MSKIKSTKEVNPADAKAIAAKIKADAVQAKKALPAINAIAKAVGDSQAATQAARNGLAQTIAKQCEVILSLKIAPSILDAAMSGGKNAGMLYQAFADATAKAYIEACKNAKPAPIVPDMVALDANTRARCAKIRKVVTGGLKAGVDIAQFLNGSVDADGNKRERNAGKGAKQPDGAMFVSFDALKPESFIGIVPMSQFLTNWIDGNKASKEAKPFLKLAGDLLQVVDAAILKTAKSK